MVSVCIKQEEDDNLKSSFSNVEHDTPNGDVVATTAAVATTLIRNEGRHQSIRGTTSRKDKPDDSSTTILKRGHRSNAKLARVTPEKNMDALKRITIEKTSRTKRQESQASTTTTNVNNHATTKGNKHAHRVEPASSKNIQPPSATGGNIEKKIESFACYRTKSLITEASHLLPLPAQDTNTEMRSKTKMMSPDMIADISFPPGCPVLFSHWRNINCKSFYSGKIGFGIVTTVSIEVPVSGTTSSKPRNFLYEVELADTKAKVMVKKENIRYAPNCPVWIQNSDTIIPNQQVDSRLSGLVLMGKPCVKYVKSNDKSRGDNRTAEIRYSVLIKLDDDTYVEKHDIFSRHVSYQSHPKEDLLILPTELNVKESSTTTWKCICTMSLSTKTYEERGSLVNRSGLPFIPLSIRKRSPEQQTTIKCTGINCDQSLLALCEECHHPTKKLKRGDLLEQTSDFIYRAETNISTSRTTLKTTDTENDGDSGSLPVWFTPVEEERKRRINIPGWLDPPKINAYLLGKIGVIGQSTGTSIYLLQERHHIAHVSISGANANSVRDAQGSIEDSLIEFVADDQSLGRLLFDMAISHDDMRRKRSSRGAVYQKDYRDLSKMTWTYVLEMPRTDEGEYHTSFLSGKRGIRFRHIRSAYNCTAEIFGILNEDIACDPYVIIRGPDKELVDKAIAFVEEKATEHMSRCCCHYASTDFHYTI